MSGRKESYAGAIYIFRCVEGAPAPSPGLTWGLNIEEATEVESLDLDALFELANQVPVPLRVKRLHPVSGAQS